MKNGRGRKTAEPVAGALMFADEPAPVATAYVEPGLTETEHIDRLASEDAEREARFRRWDEIEATARRLGFQKPTTGPAVDRPAETWPATPHGESRPEGVYHAPVHGGGLESSGRQDEVIVIPDQAPARRRSQLVMRLEAAKKLVHASMVTESSKSPDHPLFVDLEADSL